MSANITITPTEKSIDLPTMAPGRTISALESVFGPFPLELNDSHCAMLNAMAAAWGGNSDDNPFCFLADYLAEHECAVIISASY